MRVDEAVAVQELGHDVGLQGHVEGRARLLALEQVGVVAHLQGQRRGVRRIEQRILPIVLIVHRYLSELHDQVHEGGGGAVRLLGRAHGRLQQVLDGDLVPQRLVEQPLPGRQLAVGQDLDLRTDGDINVFKRP